MSDDFDGEDLRDEGMRLAEENERAEYRDAYYAQAQLEFNKMPAGTLFRFERINVPVLARIGPPHHPNAISAMSARCIKQWLEELRLEDAGASLAAKATSRSAFQRTYRKLQ